MNIQSILLSIFFYIKIINGIIIDCPCSNTCILSNISNEKMTFTNITKVSSLIVTHSNFDDINTKTLFFKEFTQLKSLQIQNNVFVNVDTVESLIQSVIDNQLYLKVFDLSHNIGINVIRKHTFNKNNEEMIIKSSECYLFTLNLSNNQIDNVEPGAFTIFKSLETLDLSYNRLKSLNGPISDVPLFKLKILGLNNNLLTEMSDETFKGLYNLEKVFLNNNLIKVLHAPCLKPLKGLRVLDVSTNHLQSMEILSPKLKILNVAVNYLEIDRIRGLDRLTYLKSLNISKNPIGSITNESFLRLISVEDLKMHSLTSLKFNSDDIFEPLINLKYLDMRKNHLNDIKSLALYKLTKLILVQLDENQLSSINISDLPVTLRYIGLQSNMFLCNILKKNLGYLRDNNIRLYFTKESPTNYSKTIQGIQCFSSFVGSPEGCSDDYLKLYFYTWHTKISSLVCLVLAITYVYILWKNKETIRRIKDEEYEEEYLLNDEENVSSCSFNYDDLLEKDKSNELY